MSVYSDLIDAIQNASKDGTSAFDATATVVRTDASIAWVHIPGGVEETPAEKTIDCKAGDAVRIRVANGRCWITGNASAPPTDDTTAEQAQTTATSASETAVQASETAEQASREVATVRQYFWHDNSGAHVSTQAQNATGTFNSIWNSAGMLFRKVSTNLLGLFASSDRKGLVIFDGDGNEDENVIATFTDEGATFRSGENSLKIGAKQMTMTTPYDVPAFELLVNDDFSDESYETGLNVYHNIDRNRDCIKSWLTGENSIFIVIPDHPYDNDIINVELYDDDQDYLCTIPSADDAGTTTNAYLYGVSSGGSDGILSMYLDGDELGFDLSEIQMVSIKYRVQRKPFTCFIGNYPQREGYQFAYGVGDDTGLANAFAVADDGTFEVDNDMTVDGTITAMKVAANLSPSIIADITTKPGISIAANNVASTTFSIAKTGYTCLGLLGYRITGTGSSFAEPYIMDMGGSGTAPTCYYGIRNRSSSAVTLTLIVRALYLKN